MKGKEAGTQEAVGKVLQIYGETGTEITKNKVDQGNIHYPKLAITSFKGEEIKSLLQIAQQFGDMWI